MSHPDVAWSPYYIGPQGIEGEPCRHGRGQRCRVGPTSRRPGFSACTMRSPPTDMIYAATREEIAARRLIYLLWLTTN